jgi:uncharacterized protein YqeY
MQDKIQQDIKAAMLAGESLKIEVLKGLKSVLQNQTIEKKADLSDDEIVKVAQKEIKKRQEAADLYGKAGEYDRKQKEIDEIEILKDYLPAQLTDEELADVVKKIIEENGIDSPQKMGMAIGMVNKQVGASAEGAKIAAEVKKQLGV